MREQILKASPKVFLQYYFNLLYLKFESLIKFQLIVMVVTNLYLFYNIFDWWFCLHSSPPVDINVSFTNGLGSKMHVIIFQFKASVGIFLDGFTEEIMGLNMYVILLPAGVSRRSINIYSAYINTDISCYCIMYFIDGSWSDFLITNFIIILIIETYVLINRTMCITTFYQTKCINFLCAI